MAKSKLLSLDEIQEKLQQHTRTDQIAFLENYKIWLEGELQKDAEDGQKKLDNLQKFKTISNGGNSK